MSFPEVVEHVCIFCGNKQKTTIWRSICADESPELKSDLLNQELNVFKCDKCERCVTLDEYGFLYSDIKESILLKLDSEEIFKTYISADIAQNDMLLDYVDYRVKRIVPTYIDLCEKIRIFEICLDDVTIEFFKFFVLAEFRKKEIKNMLFKHVKGNDLIFSFVDVCGEPIHDIELPYEKYTAMLYDCKRDYQHFYNLKGLLRINWAVIGRFI